MTPDQLKKWRKSRGLSQAAAAKLVNDYLPCNGPSTWGMWEREERAIPWQLKNIFKILDKQY